MSKTNSWSLASALGRRIGLGAACAALLLSALAFMAVPSALAGVPEFTLRNSMPDVIDPGRGLTSTVTAVNTGTAAFTGTVTVTDTLPAGMKPAGLEPESEWGGQCEISGQQAICGFEVDQLQPVGQLTMRLEYEVDENISEGPKVNVMEVTGNGGANEESVENTITIGPPDPFAIKSFSTDVTRTGFDETQAGATPEAIDTRFSFPTSVHALFEFEGINQFAVVFPAEHMKTTLVHAPAGVIANLHATPVQCTASQLSEQAEDSHMSNCPADSQIGTARILGERTIVPVYNMVAPRGTPAQFGFSFANVSIYITAHLRPSDFGFDLVTPHINSALPLSDTDVELWGIPADSSHNTARGVCLDGDLGNSKYIQHDGICPTKAPRKAFFRLPTSCSGQPLDWGVEVDTYEHPGTYHTGEDTTPAQVGCNQLEFTATLMSRPTTNVGDSPTGFEFGLKLPQNEDPYGLAEAHLRDLRVLLPEGLTVNPASADGLGACSSQQIGLVTAVGQVPAKFDGAHAACPDSSKLGSLSVYAPAVGSTLPGLVYLATPHENPFGSLIALYLVIDDPHTGIIVKVPVDVEQDPNTGRITTLVDDSAPLPFEDLKLELDQGPHGALRTPISCGSFSTSSDLTSWSAPEGRDAHPTASFDIVRGSGGGPCVSSEASAPAAPAFEAGTLEPKAGAYSPLVLKVTRRDGSQQLTGIDATLPKGLLARLAYTTYCPESALAAAAAKTGHQEQAEPSCPTSSEVGTVHIAAGAGPAPLHVQGNAYITGPYKGGPIGLAVITPAVTGPFDLGTVVVQTALRIDPETAQVRAVSDPIPHILQGVPLDLRQVMVFLNRPNYILNPTSCEPMSLTGYVSLLSGQSAAVSSPFQVGGCANLPFKPKLALRLQGGTTRTKHPALTATLTFPNGGGANVARASISLPHSEFLDQSHIGTICTRAQFTADACPVRSELGTARAVTPLLEQPLEGPVYLRSSDQKLPDLVVALRGQFEVDLVGHVDSVKANIRATFESVPDAPVSSFTLKLKGGKEGLLQNSTNICRTPHRAIALFDGQNGMTADQKPLLKARCRSSRRRKSHRG